MTKGPAIAGPFAYQTVSVLKTVSVVRTVS